MTTEHDSELDRFITVYLRQLARTGRVAEAPPEETPAWHVDERPEGRYAVVRDEVEASGVEEGVFETRRDAYLAAAMLTALASEPEGLGLDEVLGAGEEPDAETTKLAIARILRGVTRNPAAVELLLEALPRESVQGAYDLFLERMDGEEHH